MDHTQIPAVAALGRAVFGPRSVDLGSLAAKFRTGSFGPEYVGHVAYPSDTVPDENGLRVPAAYYGVFPIAVRFGDEEVLCAQSGDTMTHHNHRGKGLFIDLARRTYNTARAEGVQFVFGFPNDNSYPGFLRKLHWTFPYRMIAFTRLVPTLPIGLGRRRLGRPGRGFGPVARMIVGRLFDVVTPSGEPWFWTTGSPPAVVRDSRLWEYNAAESLFVRAGATGIALKFDGDLSIGEVAGSPSFGEMAAIMRRLHVLAAMLGAVRIKSYFSPGSRLERILTPFGRCAPSLRYGFVDFDSNRNLAALEFAYVDYDTF